LKKIDVIAELWHSCAIFCASPIKPLPDMTWKHIFTSIHRQEIYQWLLPGYFSSVSWW
jgi:hypothetical protein